jgi:hypothetical protein
MLYDSLPQLHGVAHQLDSPIISTTLAQQERKVGKHYTLGEKGAKLTTRSSSKFEKKEVEINLETHLAYYSDLL